MKQLHTIDVGTLVMLENEDDQLLIVKVHVEEKIGIQTFTRYTKLDIIARKVDGQWYDSEPISTQIAPTAYARIIDI